MGIELVLVNKTRRGIFLFQNWTMIIKNTLIVYLYNHSSKVLTSKQKECVFLKFFTCHL